MKCRCLNIFIIPKLYNLYHQLYNSFPLFATEPEIKASDENREEILSYLKDELPKETKESITTLAEGLRYFKPALTLAVTYITLNNISIEDFITRDSVNEGLYLTGVHKESRPVLYYMCAMLLINFIKRSDKDAYNILCTSAYLKQENVPDKLLTSDLGNKAYFNKYKNNL